MSDPRQYALDFGFWTRAMVADLIKRKLGVRLGVTAVGALLAQLGLTPQKPLQRAYQRDPEAIEQWRRERFPAIAHLARASGGDVWFWDESGFRADTVCGFEHYMSPILRIICRDLVARMRRVSGMPPTREPPGRYACLATR